MWILIFLQEFLMKESKKFIKKASLFLDFFRISIFVVVWLFLYNVIIHAKVDFVGYVITGILIGTISVLIKILAAYFLKPSKQ